MNSSGDQLTRAMSAQSPFRVDAVEKVPKYGAANFALKDKTGGDRHSIGPQLDYGSRL